MTQPTLIWAFSDYYAEVADYLGYGRSPSGTNITEVKRYTNEGYATFLMGIDPRTGQAYNWSFLAPEASMTFWSTVGTTVADCGTSTITGPTLDTFYPSMVGKNIVIDSTNYPILSVSAGGTTATVGTSASGLTGSTFEVINDSTYTLPDNFTYLVDDFRYGASQGAQIVHPRSVQYLRTQKAGAGVGTGTPVFAAVQPIAYTSTIGQRWEVMTYPTSGSNLTVYYRYRLTPSGMTSDTQYPMGGAIHSLTILEQCLAIAQSRRPMGDVDHQARADKYMASSIDIDAHNRPRNIGYNGNGVGVVGIERRGLVTYSTG